MVRCQLSVVGTGMAIKAVGPRPRHYLDEVVITFLVFGKQDEVPAYVALVGVRTHIGVGNVGLAAKNGLKQLALLLIKVNFQIGDNVGTGRRFVLLFVNLFLYLLNGTNHISILFIYIVVQLLDAKHVAVVGECHATHAIGDGLINNALDRSLTIKERILRVNVKMDERKHIFIKC